MESSGIAGNWEIGQAGLAGEVDAGRGQDFSPEERNRRHRNRTGNAFGAKRCRRREFRAGGKFGRSAAFISGSSAGAIS
jgi:hypothetical protein